MKSFTSPFSTRLGRNCTARRQTVVVAMLLVATGALAWAGDDKEEAIKKDRQRYEGTWRVVTLVVDGNPSNEADARRMSVVNGPDGTWSIRLDGREISKGTSTIDPTQTPKTLDFTPTEGESKGALHLGIYELGEDSRKLCFAPPGRSRPTEFASRPGSQYILVTFSREKAR